MARNSIQRLLILSVMLLASVGLLGFLIGTFAPSADFGPQGEVSRLSVKPEDCSIGEVWAQTDLKWQMTIHNPTHEQVVVRKFVTTCTCTHVDPSSIVVPPLGQATATITLDTTQQPMREGDGSAKVRNFEVEVRPIVDGLLAGQRHRSWKVAATVKTPFRFEKSIVDFQRSDGPIVSGRPEPPQRVKLYASFPLTDLEVSDPGGFVDVDIERLDKSGQAFELRVQPSDKLAPGRYLTDLHVVAVSPEHGKLPALMLRVLLPVENDVVCIPNTLAFGTQPISTSRDETVTLMSRLGCDFAVDSWESASPSVHVEQVCTESANSGAKQFRVRVRPEHVGDHLSTITFKIKELDRATMNECTARISFRGVPLSDVDLPNRQSADVKETE